MRIKWINVWCLILAIILTGYCVKSVFISDKDPTFSETRTIPVKVSALPLPQAKQTVDSTISGIKAENGKKYSIEIVKHEFKLYIKDNDNIVKRYDIAIGLKEGQKQKAGDMTTPTGEFFVEDIINATAWTHDFKDGKGEIDGAYGPWFISLDTGGWDGIGIHGTHDPKSIGTKVSEGCVRMLNDDVLELKEFIQAGNSKDNATIVVIRE